MAVPWPSCRHSPFGHRSHGSAGVGMRPRVLDRHHLIDELGTSTFWELPDAFRWLTDGLRSRLRVRIQLAPPASLRCPAFSGEAREIRACARVPAGVRAPERPRYGPIRTGGGHLFRVRNPGPTRMDHLAVGEIRAYWHWKSCRVGGRPRIGSEIRALIRRMSRENPL